MLIAFFYLLGMAATAWRFKNVNDKYGVLKKCPDMLVTAVFGVIAWPYWWFKVWRNRWMLR